jgi:hypothetical protein
VVAYAESTTHGRSDPIVKDILSDVIMVDGKYIRMGRNKPDLYCLLLLLALYSASHAAILSLGNAIYWDDWAYVDAPSRYILSDFEKAGAFFNYAAWVHIFFSSLGPWVYKCVTFVSFYLAGAFFYLVAKRDLLLSRTISFWAAALFLTLPLNIARVASIDVLYTLSVAFFMAGWFFIRNSRLSAIILFSLSFNTQSLLVFYSIPIAFLYFRQSPRLSVGRFLLEYLGLLLLPFIWFALKNIFFKPYGVSAGYNSNYDFNNLWIAMEAQLSDLIVYGKSLSADYTLLAAIPLLSLTFWIFFISKGNLNFNIRLGQSVRLFLLGLLTLTLGLFPYWIIGLVPTFVEWTSRHQLLMPFGASICLVSIIGVLGVRIRHVLLSLILSLSVGINNRNYWDFYLDWRKQVKIIEELRSSERARTADLLVFSDDTRNAIGRRYRFYEWSGMIARAFPGENFRFGLNREDEAAYNLGQFDSQFPRFYSSSGHTRRVSNAVQYVGVHEEKATFRLEITGNPQGK